MEIKDVVGKFGAISLAEMDGVKLMNRVDRKFWFNRQALAELLDDVADLYYILEVEGVRDMPYSTTYYDTESNQMFADHHRGKGNRYKIRRRNYISTQSSFLEIKFKSNKGRTVKVRRASHYLTPGFDHDDRLFIESNTPYRCSELSSVLVSRFNRLMLVSKGMDERCTIDTQMSFTANEGASEGANEGASELFSLVVVEVKSDGRGGDSPIIEALNRRRIKPSGFSKYCVGRSMASHSKLKQNNFKEKLREIEKRSGEKNF